MSDDNYNLALLVPKSLIRRLDALKGPVRDSLDLDALVLSPKVTRSTVARLALVRGLELLEAGRGLPQPAPPRAPSTAPAAPKARPATRIMDGARAGRRKRRSSREKPPATVAGVKLRAWRDREGLTQTAAAERAEVAQSHWSRWEQGKAVPTDAAFARLVVLVPDLTPKDFSSSSMAEDELVES